MSTVNPDLYQIAFSYIRRAMDTVRECPTEHRFDRGDSVYMHAATVELSLEWLDDQWEAYCEIGHTGAPVIVHGPEPMGALTSLRILVLAQYKAHPEVVAAEAAAQATCNTCKAGNK